MATRKKTSARKGQSASLGLGRMAAVLIGPGVFLAIGSIVAGVVATLLTATAAVVDWKTTKDAEKAEKAEKAAKEGGGAEAVAKPK